MTRIALVALIAGLSTGAFAYSTDTVVKTAPALTAELSEDERNSRTAILSEAAKRAILKKIKAREAARDNRMAEISEAERNNRPHSELKERKKLRMSELSWEERNMNTA